MNGGNDRVDDPVISVQPSCPTCTIPGVPIVFGLPVPAAREAAAEQLLALAGCLRPDHPPHWRCPAGHEWSTSDAERMAAIDEVLSGRPRCPACGGATRYLLYGTIDDFEEFAVEIARGDAELATSLGPRGVNWQHVCRTCRTIS
jgi:hypothetical protein